MIFAIVAPITVVIALVAVWTIVIVGHQSEEGRRR